MECTSESLGAVLRAFCPCGLVRQALNYILRGVRIGADRVKITLFLRGAERVHVPTVKDFLAKPQSWGAAPRFGIVSRLSSHQGAQARPAHPLSPNFARHLRLTNQAALWCQGMGRGGGGAAGRTVKTRNVHTSVRRPAHRTPRPQNLHSDPDLQIRQPCGVRGRGGAGGGAAGRTPERKFGKLRIRAWPEPRSQRPGLKLGRQAKQNFLSGHTSFGDRGCSE